MLLGFRRRSLDLVNGRRDGRNGGNGGLRLLESLFSRKVESRKQLPDPGFGKSLVRAVPHLLEHVVDGFLNTLFGHPLFPVLQVPACPGIAAARAPRRGGELFFNALLVRFGKHCREIKNIPRGLTSGLADDLCIRRSFGLPRPVVRRLLHERINIGLGIRRVPKAHHVPVDARMRLALLPEKTPECTASERADNRTHNGNHGTHSCAYRSERSCGKGTKPPPGCTAKPRRNPAVLALRKPKRPAEHGVAKRAKRGSTKIGSGRSKEGGLGSVLRYDSIGKRIECRLRGHTRACAEFGQRAAHCRLPRKRTRCGRTGKRSGEPSRHRVIDGIRNARRPRPRHKVAEAGKVAHPANAARTTGAPRRIRHPARAEHTGHRPRNLNRNGPGDRHVHQIGKERREQ